MGASLRYVLPHASARKDATPMKLRYATFVLLMTAGLTLTAQTRPAPPLAQRPAPMARTTPSLVVLVVVDQFRGDYIQRYGHTWSRGRRFPLSTVGGGVAK